MSELRSLLGLGGCLILESHSRIRGWGGVGRGWAGGGAGKRTIRAAAQAGGSQAGHGGCPRGAATGSRRRPRAPGPPRLLGLRCAGHSPESPGGRLQPSPAGAGVGDHPAARCHHARLWLPMPLSGEHAPAWSGKGGCGVCGPQPRRAGLFLAWASRCFSSHSSFAPRHPLAPRTCGTRASQPCWSLDSCSSCRCSCLPWPATAASACASAWPIASCLTAEPSTGAGATRSRGQPGPRQGPRLLQPQERSGSEDPRVKNYPDDCPPSRSAQGLEALTRA